MHTEIGKVTSKGQTTIPAAFRKELGIDAGDNLLFECRNDELIIKKAHPIDVEYYRAIQAGFASEWDSPEDNEAFNDL